MNIRFYLDPGTGAPHLERHGVTRQEVEEALLKPGEDRPGREGARVAIGRTRNGRYLRVIYVPDPEPDSLFVITAYELKGKPLTAYRKRSRRRGR
jgi:murein tripeptide amidase MpaA